MTEDKDQEGPEESAFDKFVRDEQGRFAKQDQVEPAPVEAAPEPQAEQPPAPPQPASPPPASPEPAAPPQDAAWQMKALLDERDKRQALQRQYEETQRRLQEYEARQQQQPEVDPFTDPDGYKQSLEAQLERKMENRLFAQSEYFAAQQHGAETVQTAMQWLGSELQRDPSIWSKIKDNPHPADFVVKLHKRSQGLAKLGDKDPEDFAREWAMQNLETLLQQRQQPGAHVAAAPSPQPPKSPPPRPSIASAPAAAPVAAQDHAFNEAEIFKGMFGKR